jgi:hypothetical protein
MAVMSRGEHTSALWPPWHRVALPDLNCATDVAVCARSMLHSSLQVRVREVRFLLKAWLMDLSDHGSSHKAPLWGS